MFSPVPDNEYLHVPQVDEGEEIAMEEIVVSTTAPTAGLRNIKGKKHGPERWVRAVAGRWVCVCVCVRVPGGVRRSVCTV